MVREYTKVNQLYRWRLIFIVDRILFRFFILWYSCGVLLVGFNLLPSWLEWANAVFLIAAGVLGGFYFYREYKIFGLLFSFFVFFSTILVEYLGVQYGLFFGHYFYNPDFGLYIADIPLTIGTAWLMVIATTHALVKPMALVVKQPFFQWIIYAIVGALAAVIMDLILDPVAANVKQYWVWHGDGLYYGIPFSNFVGWFFIALTLHALLWIGVRYLKRTKSYHPYWHSRMVLLYILMIAMFSIIALINNIFFAPLLTIVLMSALVWVYKRTRRSQ